MSTNRSQLQSAKPISTVRFALAPTVLARRDFSRIASRWWWCAALPLLVCLALAATDWRWLVVALALIFVLIPTAAMFAWFAIASRPSVVNEIYPHTVTFTPASGTISVQYFPLNEHDDTDGDHAGTSRVPGSRNIASDQLHRIDIDGKHIAIIYRQPGNQLAELLIPASAFESNTDASAFLNNLYSMVPPSPAT